jgi:hypothetical protein
MAGALPAVPRFFPLRIGCVILAGVALLSDHWLKACSNDHPRVGQVQRGAVRLQLMQRRDRRSIFR